MSSEEKKTLVQREEVTLQFWETHEIFKRTLEKKSPKGNFVFYDGPPFATGLPHYGHILASIIKDVIPRWKTMQGFRVARRWGWDCHGLPVENEVEKELGFKTKKEIEQFGVGKFNETAQKIVMRYGSEWRSIIPRIGRWVDMENDYRTMDGSYTESVWWAFKTLYDKGLVYEGKKSMHLCPRCETTLSNFEVTQGYKNITDLSVYLKFTLADEPNTFLLAWTTTPWTLPGNAALAVHREQDYSLVESDGARYIIGSARLAAVMKDKPYLVVRTFKGRELVGKSYQPLFGYYADDPTLQNRENGWKIYGADFVTTTDGTGIVHIAPAFGEDDYALAEREKLPFIQHIATDGTMKREVRDFAELSAKPKGNPRETDEKIANVLEARQLLFAREPHTHDYPHCWRCDTPLLNYAAPSWFVKVSGMREQLVTENKEIAWVPREVGEYRFGNWLAEAKDWAISRARFWGAPIPVWRCAQCKALRTLGSIDELRRASSGRITKVVLLRHGESVKNVQKMYDDSPDAFPLTSVGRAQARAAGEAIQAQGIPDFIYASPVRRARETAEQIAKQLGLSVTIDEDLREVDSGEWDGKSEDDPVVLRERAARNALPHPEYYRHKRGTTGESWEDVEARMKRIVARIVAKHRGESVLLVSHEGPLVYLLKTLDHLSFEETEQFYRKNYLHGYATPKTVFVDSERLTEVDLHRPMIDEIPIPCEACEKKTGAPLMRRVPEVFDCWFESGAMPFAQAHYPFDAPSSFQPKGWWFRPSRGFPAHFIAEGLDQTRGWFYSLLVLGTALFGKSPYQSVVVNGIVLAENGEKMSKRLKNYPDPLLVVGKYGADALRLYLLSSPVVRGEDLRFSERGVDEVAKKVLNRLENALAFYKLYASSLAPSAYTLAPSHILDRWIVARLNQLTGEVTRALEAYELDKATRPLGEFVDDLSTWYLRRSRERIKSEVLEEREAALSTLGFVLREFAKVLAPFAPFAAEHLYRAVGGKTESVHLEEWPSEGKINETVLKEMEDVRKIVSLGLEARAKANIKVRQPLSKLNVKSEELKVSHEGIELIRDEVNVKEVIYDTKIQNEVELDTILTPELKDEGALRELTRFVQEMRKAQGLRVGELATLAVSATGASRRFIEQHEQEISHIASLKDIVISDTLQDGAPFQADELSLGVLLRKEIQ